jgi:hypothetical protein
MNKDYQQQLKYGKFYVDDTKNNGDLPELLQLTATLINHQSLGKCGDSPKKHDFY